MKHIAIAAAAVLALGLAACETTPTPYQPLSSSNQVSGGFTDQRLDDTHFRVTFKGNDLTSREQVETYLLYRAAELTVSQGFDWFEMVDRHTVNRGDAFVSGYGGYWAPYWRFHGGRGWGQWDPFWDGPWGGFGGDYDVQQIDRYEAIAEIAVGHGPKPAGDVRAFDARQVMSNLGPKIVRAAPH
jgi:hypothetical protein